jgi:DNA-binding NtrC family response regulator
MMKDRKILLAEDETMFAVALKEILEAEGYEVEIAATTDQALARAKEATFDCVLTNLLLPGPSGLALTNGLELIDQLHAARPELAIILMTAHRSEQTAQIALKLGATDYIFKPFQPKALLDTVEAAIATAPLLGRNEAAAREHKPTG